MLRRFFRWLRLLLLFTAVVIGVAYLSLSAIAGIVVKRVFEWGPGCSVTFDNPRVSLSPLRASIDNVVILAPGEVHGARAQRISTGIEYYSLREHILKLMPLRIDGADVESIGADSSLLRILRFVIPDDDEIRATSWDISLATLYISPPPDNRENFVFGWDDLRFNWRHFAFAGEVLDSPPEEDTYLSAIADELTVNHPAGSYGFSGFRGRFPIKKGLLSIEQARFGVGADESGQGSVSGKVLLPQGALDIAVNLSIPLATLPQFLEISPELSNVLPGAYSIDAQLLGFYSAPIARGQIRSVQIDAGAPAISGNFLFDKTSETLDLSNVRLSAFPLSTLQRVAHSFVEDIPLPTIGGPSAYDARVTAELSGRLVNNSLDTIGGNVRLDDLWVGEQRGLNLTTQLTGKRDSVKFSQVQFTHPLTTVTGEGNLDLPTKKLEVKLSTPEIKLGASGAIQQVTLSAQIPLASPKNLSGEIAVQGVSLLAGAGVIANAKPLNFRLANQTLSMEPTPITALDYALTIGGEVGLERGWNAGISGNWTLKQLIPTPESMEQFAGAVEMDLAVRGPWDAPQLRGPIKVRDGEASLRIDRTFVGIDGLELDAEFNGDDIKVEAVRGRVGTGTVSGSGMFTNVLTAEREGSLSLRLRDVVVEPLSDLVVEGEGDILFRVPQSGRPIIGGKVFLRTAVYRERFDLRRLIEVIRAATRGKTAATGNVNAPGVLDLDLEIAAENGLVVETDLFQSELRGSVRLDGPVDAIKTNGKVEVIEGSFGLQANRFEIIHGSLTFVPSENPLNPRLDIVSETNLSAGPRGVQHLVQLVVSGQIATPKVTLSSDSGLPESEILSLLTVGAGIEGASLLGGGRRVAQLSYVELLNPKKELSFGERLSGLTGFSDLRIEEVTRLDSTESVPVVSVRRSLFEGAEAVLQTEISGHESTAAHVTYDLTPTIDFLVGWKNYSAKDPESTRGSFDIGFVYQQSYPGVGLFTPEVFSLE